MSIPAQGAVGAETMTAGLTLSFDPSKLFDVVAEVGDGGAALGCRLVGIMLTGGQSSFREDVGLAFYGVFAAPALASPRADSDERTAGDWRKVMRDLISEHDKHVCLHEETHRSGAIWTICDHCGRKWADDEGGFQPYEEPAAVTAAWALLKCEDATPAQTAGAVPDSLRETMARAIEPGSFAVFENTECEPVNSSFFRQRIAAAYRIADTLLAGPLAQYVASHPAGQSAGSGAEGLAYETDGDGAWTWLVWAISPAGAHLAAIAHSEAKAEGYRDATARLYPGARVHVERAPVDHTFGASDLRSVAYRAAMKDARRQGKPGFADRPKSAPNSPRTGDEGTDREIIAREIFIAWFLANTSPHDGDGEEGALAWKAGTDFPDVFTLAYAAADRVLAARPAVAEFVRALLK